MIRLLGRQTSGNVQKAIFCLEELGLPYTREDYGRQFGNTLTDAYRKLSPEPDTALLSEAVAGSEEAFVVRMNQEATRLGMKNTRFANATGLPSR